MVLEQDQAIVDDIKNSIESIAKQAKFFETECLFSQEYDQLNCFLDINAGAGGTESHDWAEMLLRMYLRFAERLKFKAEIVHIMSGEEAGIKSCTIRICGPNAYGWFRSESGVHRLVRISPFNAAKKRMTSFASAFAYPEVDQDIDIQINEKDLRIDTYRASGPGGQNVNKIDSAVRITHWPTKIVVQCQTDRSQHRNKSEAMKMLKSRLYDLELSKKQEIEAAHQANKTDNSWGNQIRSYTLQPYQLVKDLRSGYSVAEASKVLDGELEKFAYAMLAGNTPQTTTDSTVC